MELEAINSLGALEDGELDDDSDGIYTPLERPANGVEWVPSALVPAPKIKDDIADESGGEESSDSSDSDNCFKMKRRLEKGEKKTQNTKRTVLFRVNPSMEDELEDKKKSKFKKYDIWTTSLQEDSLTENMRGIGVATDLMSDRNVENYDFTLKYRLGEVGESLKRRRYSRSDDELSDQPSYKRTKVNYSQSRGSVKDRLGRRMNSDELSDEQSYKRSKSTTNQKKKSAKDRLGRRKSSSSSDSENEPKYLTDLTINEEDDQEVIAKEIANNLFEKKDDLILRLVNVLGAHHAISLFKETQRIEKEGGMMIVNRKRRRTPGGVFFFLLKHDDTVNQDQRKLIFYEENKNSNKDRKAIQAIKRDQKVEELKKRLTQTEHLPVLCVPSSSTLATLKPEHSANISNPPPSPVGQENSPEYKSHAINLVNESSNINKLDMLKSANDSGLDGLTTYDDDFLDINCDDMDMI